MKPPGPPPLHPGVKYPPPLLFVVGFVAGAVIDRAWPLPLGSEGFAWEVAGVGLMVLGFALMFWGMITFARARTAIIPHRPASMLVLGGPYRMTRNPMYVGFNLVYVGGTLLLGSAWPLILLPLLILILVRTVIQREERYLRSAFGAQYEEYCGRVRRWI